ncbi:murein DD-endopeptidase MepM/ murein hydrolase activator NlpD [Rhodovulum iodosum]|uniref:Murein DD-endopeptidase MepM/ murein hydrolase activator NlpD n=2 Tax=Rhodovulum iodosum TaxID=68291 RepID=A0ABV3XZK4_9RHOB
MLPEQRLFLRSDSETRFIRLSPATQFIAFAGSALVVGWAMVATAVLLMDNVGAGNLRDQAQREQSLYEERLNALALERDNRATEAQAAQERFNLALAEVSKMQSALLASEDRRKELETGIEVIQTTLRSVMAERDEARAETARLAAALDDDTGPERRVAARATNAEAALGFLSAALEQTARERDQALADAAAAYELAEALAYEQRLTGERNDRIFTQLEEALAVSVEPLDKMFRAAGLKPDSLIEAVRKGYSGIGGPLTPLSLSTKGTEPHPDEMRSAGLISRLDRLNMYRMAAEKAPFATPLKSSFRFTSPFGMRSHPTSGRYRMHEGADFASDYGTPIYATADGVVTKAGWVSGYGRMVEIRHEFGIETLYGHMAKLRVTEGQRVSRGDRIGDMGSSGRSTGTHLHYEVRVSGTPVNPMTYIKAARDVF